MPGTISEKIIKPHDCVFITPLPLRKEEFIDDMENGRQKFLSKFISWSRYDAEIGLLLRHVIGEIKIAGCGVVTRAGLRDFSRLLQSDAPTAIMLMAHWNETGIDLYDGIVDAQWLLDNLHTERKKIFDLAVCHPEPVMQAIKNHRPNSIAHGLTKRMSATPYVWLRYFSLVVYTLKNSNSTYLNASEMAFKGLLNLLP